MNGPTNHRSFQGEKQQLVRRKAHTISCHKRKNIFFLQKSLSLSLKFRIIRFTVMVTKSSPEYFEGNVNLQNFFLAHLLRWDLPAVTVADCPGSYSSPWMAITLQKVMHFSWFQCLTRLYKYSFSWSCTNTSRELARDFRGIKEGKMNNFVDITYLSSQ